MKTMFVPQIAVRSNVKSGSGGGYVNGVWYPDMSGTCGTSTTPTPTPPSTPAPPTSGGGYVNGVWYPDMSGTCG
jgi:hypothetical protein